MGIAIIVHGGAGAWDRSQDRLGEAVTACNLAATEGRSILLRGGSALDAIEAAVRMLEDCPVLDAGRGSYPNASGEVEMDALIMNGLDLTMGAVAAVQNVYHPVSLARRVMEDSGHHLLVGEGAGSFADSIAFPRCDLDDLLVEESVERSLAAKDHQPGDSAVRNLTPTLGDTVGAVAIDLMGNLAAATSTGGTLNKLPGRVGDSPLVGCGAYADNWTAAVSATGYGEALMRVVISKQVCDFVSAGLSAQSACATAIRLLEERTGSSGGLISVDARGQVGFAFNTNAMPYAYAIDDRLVTDGYLPRAN